MSTDISNIYVYNQSQVMHNKSGRERACVFLFLFLTIIGLILVVIFESTALPLETKKMEKGL